MPSGGTDMADISFIGWLKANKGLTIGSIAGLAFLLVLGILLMEKSSLGFAFFIVGPCGISFLLFVNYKIETGKKPEETASNRAENELASGRTSADTMAGKDV